MSIDTVKLDASLGNTPRTLSARYENFLVLLCALLNSLAGIVVDLYAPSLPAIGREFHISSAAAQNTIVVTIVGYAAGQLFFGLLSDWGGRRASILFGLGLFTLGSACAMVAHTVALLLFARTLQGFAAGSAQVVSRAVLIDSMKGQRLERAVVYLSAAFALGLIAGPYIGGAIEQHLGWRWSFGFYSGYSMALLVTAIFGLRESLSPGAHRTPYQNLSLFGEIAKRPVFIVYAFQLGFCFIGFTLWNQIGPYIVQRELHHDAMYFGLTALSAGCAYLCGSLANRVSLRRSTPRQRMVASLVSFLVGVMVIARSGTSLDLTWIVPGVMFCAFAQGLTFPNVLTKALGLFPERAGFAASLQGFGMLVVGSGGLAVATLPTTMDGFTIAGIYGSLLFLATGAFVAVRRYV